MTRPFARFLPTARPAIGYPARGARSAHRANAPAKGVFLGGTVVWSGLEQTIAQLNSLPMPRQIPSDRRYVHITLSLPPGVVLSKAEWLDLCAHVLDGLGWPNRTMPWLAFGHPNRIVGGLPVQHAHIGAQLSSWTGRPLDTEDMRSRCDRAEAQVRHFLGIPPDPRPPLAPNLPRRRQTTDGHRRIAEALDAVLRRSWPEGPAALAAELTAFDVTLDISPNTHGCNSYSFSYRGGPPVRGKTLSEDLTPSALAARFQLNARLRAAASRLDELRLLAALRANANNIEKSSKEIIDASKKRTHRLPLEPARGERDAAHAGGIVRGGPALECDAGRGEGRHDIAAATAGLAGFGRGGVAGAELAASPESDQRAAGNDRTAAFGNRHVAGGAERPSDADPRNHGTARGFLRERGPAQLLTTAREIAKSLGLTLRPKFLPGGRALRLSFTDATAVEFSQSGLRLATSAGPASMARRFASALAKRLGWVALTDRPRWPVPNPTSPGDWLSVAPDRLNPVLHHVLHHAEIRELAGVPSLAERFRRLSVGSETVPPMPRGTGSRPRLLLLSLTAFPNDRAILSARAEQIEDLGRSDPDLLIFWVREGENDFLLRSPREVAAVLRSKLALNQPASPAKADAPPAPDAPVAAPSTPTPASTPKPVPVTIQQQGEPVASATVDPEPVDDDDYTGPDF